MKGHHDGARSHFAGQSTVLPSCGNEVGNGILQGTSPVIPHIRPVSQERCKGPRKPGLGSQAGDELPQE